MTESAVPKCTSWMGHKFRPRYSTVPPEWDMDGIKGAAGGIALVIERLTAQKYEGDVCTRCGTRSLSPTKD